LISHAREDTENKLNSFARNGHEGISYKTFDNRGGFGYVYFENKTEDVTLEATVEMLGS